MHGEQDQNRPETGDSRGSSAPAEGGAAKGTGDLDLLAQWRAGSEKAGATLFERHFASIHRFFLNKCSARMDDLIQETFLRCVESQHRFRGASSFKTFLFGIATNVLYEDIRMRAKQGLRVDIELSSAMDTAPSPSTFAAQRQQWDLLLGALARIPLAQQVVLELHYLQGFRGPEIAEVLDVSEGTVRSRLRLGLERLRREVDAVAASRGDADEAMSALDSRS